MANQYFSIKEQVFDIQFTNRSLAYELQNRISRVFNDRLARVMNDRFEALVPDDILLRFDSLTLDLGTVSLHSLEEELETRLTDSLNTEFAGKIRLLKENRPSEGNEAVQVVPGDESLLEYFLLQGVLPWWVQSGPGFALDDCIERLFSSNPSGLRSLIVRLGTHEYVRRRLVYQFGETSIQRFITVLEPSESEYIFSYHKDVVRIQRAEQVVQAESAVFEKAVWQFILNYLLDDRGSEFNRKHFVKSTLKQMSANFNIAYEELLTLFYRAVASHIAHDKQLSSLETVISTLATEEQLPEDEPYAGAAAFTEPVLSKDPVQLSEKAELLRYYLLYGTLPAGALSYRQEDLVVFFEQLVAHVPYSLKQLFAEIAAHEMFAERLYTLPGRERAREILYRLFPQEARLVITFSSALELLQSQYRLLPVTQAELKKKLDSITLRHIFSSQTGSAGEVLLGKIANELSVTYGADTKQWFPVFYQRLQEEFRQGIIHSNLPEVVGRLHEQIRSADPTVQKEANDLEIADAPDPAEEKKSLYDTLAYLLQYGYAPWWGKSFLEHVSPEQLLKELVSSSPQRTAQLVRFAGMEMSRQKRLLSMAGLHTWLDILAVLPGGTGTTAIVKRTLEWVTGEIPGSRETMGRIILQSVWDDLILHGYRDISITSVYARIIAGISGHAGMTQASIAKVFASKAEGQGDEEHALVKEVLKDLAQLLKKQDTVEADEGDVFAQFIHSRFAEQLPGGLLAAITIKQINKQETGIREFFEKAPDSIRRIVAKEADTLIRYYITWGVLPDNIPVSGKEESRQFIRRLLKLSYLTDARQLALLVRSQSMDEKQLVQLASLFSSNKGGMEKKLYHFFDNLRSPVQPAITAEEKEQREKAGDALRAYLLAMKPGSKTISNEEMYTTLLDMLAYFFQWNRLPDRWRTQQPPPLPQALRQAFLLLYTGQKTAVQKLLQDTLQVVPARLFFHDLFAESAGGVEKEIALFLQPYKEVYLQKIAQPVQPVQLDLIWEPDEQVNRNEIPGADQLAHLVGRQLASGTFDREAITALFQLYTVDPRKLESIFSGGAFLLEATIRLYNLLITLPGSRAREIMRLLQPYWQKDMYSVWEAAGIKTEESDPAQLTVTVFRQLLDDDAADIARNTLWELAVSSPLFTRYLIDKKESSTLAALVEKRRLGWGTDTVPFIHAIYDLFTSVTMSLLERDKIAAALQQFSLLFISGRMMARSREEYLQALFMYLRQSSHNIPVTVFAGLLQHVRDKGIAATDILSASSVVLQNQLVNLVSYMDNRLLEARERLPADAGDETATERERKRKQEQLIREELERKRLEEEERLRKEAQKIQEDKRNKIYIRNAGLVLLHPFLGTFFSRLGLVDKGQFTDEAAQHRAVLLLHYLSYGRTETEEFELPLNKVLCGLPVEEVAPVTIELTEEEIAVSEEIFQVLFQRWEKMKNTTVAGFRASFLQREGALSRNEDNWELRVEQRSYDMLLDTLPWSFGMIKQPWMKQILTVEWT